MKRIRTEKEKKLQRMLIPLNIFVCILALAAAISLFIAPIIKVDFGKIFKNEEFRTYMMQAVDEAVHDGLQGSSQEGIDYSAVVKPVVNSVLDSAEGSLTVSTAGSLMSIAFADENGKREAFINETVAPLADTLIDSVVEGVSALFRTEEGKTVLEEAIVSAVAAAVSEQTDNLTEQDVRDLTAIFKNIENAGQGGVTVESVANDFADGIETAIGAPLSDEERQEITEQIVSIYNETQAELDDGETVTMESVVCVMVSKNVNLDEININGILGNISNGGTDAVKHKIAADGEGGGFPGETGEVPADQPVCKTYEELLGAMGFDENLEELKQQLRTTVTQMMQDITGGNDEVFVYYGYPFYGMLVFIVPWLILFLFSFVHIFLKNRRFTMWYVKLYSFIPGLIALAILLAPTILPIIPGAGEALSGEMGPVINAMLGGISSFMWISGVCYVLLWFVSIFWAFPIKRKIRKEIKLGKQLAKSGGYGYDYSSYGDGSGYSDSSYGSGYGDGYDDYGSYNSYDDDY